MKRILYLFLISLPLGLGAQNMYNVASILENDLNGTARFVGMAGSMGSLGGDVSVMGTNPAGIGLYRGGDVSITGNINFNNNEAAYEGDLVKSKSTDFAIGNASFVLSNKIDGQSLKFMNIGFSYRHKNNLSGEFEMAGPAGIFSQQYAIEKLYSNNSFNLGNLDRKLYQGLDKSWLALLAADAGLYYDNENYFTENGTLCFTPTSFGYFSEEKGGVDEIDLNVSVNISDRLYLGATFGFVTVDYDRYSMYYEDDEIGEIYSLENFYKLEGQGFDIKLGAIFRPFKYSPFKIGLAVHTPTWYKLEEYSSANICGPYEGDGVFDTRDPELYGEDMFSRYRLSTPWRFNASMSYTFGTMLALNAEYEYADYSSAEFGGSSFVAKEQNEEISCNMKEQHIARIGAELNVDGFALRAGYSYTTAPFKEVAYKGMFNAAVTETSTEYSNKYEKNAVTLGCGYRGKSLYFDVAYMLQTQKSDFYTYYDPSEVNPAAKVENNRHSVVATVGMRF